MRRASNQLLADSIRRMVRAKRLDQLHTVIDSTHPADLAHVMSSLTGTQRIEVFNEITDTEKAAEVLSELDDDLRDRVVQSLADDTLGELLEEMAPDDVADLLQFVGFDRKERLVGEMSMEEQSEAELLIAYDPESAGGLMSTDFFVVHEDTTAAEAIKILQTEEGEQPDIIFYLYIVNDHDHLIGVASLRALVRVAGHRPVRELMISDVIRVNTDADQEDVARLVARYNLLALPVIDPNNKLVGVVTVDDVIDVIRTEATEDVMLLAGAGDSRSPHESAIESFRNRFPWIIPSFVAGILGVVIVSYYESTLEKTIPLVALIPMIMGVAGNVGTQSSMMCTRWLATGKLHVGQIRKFVLREFVVGGAIGFLFGGLISAIVVGFFSKHALLAESSLSFAVVSGASMVVATSISAALGAAAPLIFAKFGRDPATATGPVVITAIDVLAVWIYLFTATTFL